MEDNALAWKVGDRVYFNAASHYFRQHYYFGVITRVQPKGALHLHCVVVNSHNATLSPVYGQDIVSPDWDKHLVDCVLQPKRGKHAGPSQFRWNKTDITLFEFDPNHHYTVETCW